MCQWVGLTPASQDHAEAAKWYRRAAEQGYQVAQDNLGLVCSSGADVQNETSSKSTFYHILARCIRAKRQSAEKKRDAATQFSLGESYLDYLAISVVPGTGSLNHACAWLRAAAEQGHSEAKEKLASLVSLLSPSELAESERLYEQYSKAKSSPI